MNNVSQLVFRSRAVQRQPLREGLIKQLYPVRPIPSPYTGSRTPNPLDKPTQVLNDLASSFSRFAGNQQTAFDNGASRSNKNSDAAQMKRQVESAFGQVLGRAIGYSPESFVSALNGAFPSTSDGQVNFMPSRSMVSLYSPNVKESVTNPNYTPLPIPTGSSVGQLPARQATLYRQAGIVAADALRVLAGLHPFVPEANLEQVEALRAQVQTEINSLMYEFKRIEEPRPERVRAYFDELALHLNEFGRRAFLDKVTSVVSPDDEAQVAGFALLRNYRGILRNIWDTFYDVDRSTNFFSLSERVERANILLPIIARGNADFEAAMDSVDFTENERRSMATKFSDLVDPNVKIVLIINGLIRSVQLPLTKPDITVFDLTEWLDRFANFEGPNSLSDAGQYGLDFVTDQADTLFWVIAPIVGHLKTIQPSFSGRTTLDQVLSNERVAWALDNLLIQLNVLAKLAVPGGKRNRRVL